MLPDTEIVNPSSNCVITSSRIFNVPVELMFRAWTEPEHLSTWWGPKGFTNTFHEFDLQPKGFWRFTMHGPDGGNYKNECQYIAVNKPEKLVWNHISPPQFQIAVNFEPVDTATKVIFRMIFNTAEECRKVRTIAVDANEENFDKLAAALEQMQ